MRQAGRNARFRPLAAAPEKDPGIGGWGVEFQNGKPVFTIEQIVHQLTRTGLAWNGIGANPVPSAGLGTITYGFFESGAQVYSSERNQFQPLSETQRAAVRDAFAFWGELVNVTFAEAPVATADINLGNLATTEDYFSAYAQLSEQLARGGRHLAQPQRGVQPAGRAGRARLPDAAARNGHALGIPHPGNYNAAPDVDLTYAANAEYFQDSLQYTIMSYFPSSSTGAVRTSFAATPMAHDIAAIQSLYGANMATRTGDTVYGFHSNAGRAAFDFALNVSPVVAIWDAGGRDTLDFSGWSTNSRIDLAPGGSSDGGGQTTNVQIAFGATIENAVGGAGDDLMSGNASNNALRGGGGNDRLNGGAGSDRQQGGAGADIFVFTALGHSRDYALRSDGKKFMPDVLSDFLSGTDKIDLGAIDAVTATPGDDAFTFIGTGAFTNQAGQLRYEVLNGQVHIYGDVNGDGGVDLHIVAGGTQLQAVDFLF